MNKLIELANNPLMIVVVMLIIVIIILLVPKPKSLPPPAPPLPPVPIDIPSIVNAIRIKTGERFLSDSEITSISKSILKITYQNEKGEYFSGQCFVYAHNNGTAYIGLPKHCYCPKNKNIVLKDYTGKSYRYEWKKVRYFEKIDAAMIPIPNSLLLHLPALCEEGLIKTRNQLVNNSVFCVTPFNKRGMKVKSGKIEANENALFDFFCGEGGDSGSLVVGKYGVIGMHRASSNEDARKTFFVDIQKFEDLYIALST